MALAVPSVAFGEWSERPRHQPPGDPVSAKVERAGTHAMSPDPHPKLPWPAREGPHVPNRCPLCDGRYPISCQDTKEEHLTPDLEGIRSKLPFGEMVRRLERRIFSGKSHRKDSSRLRYSSVCAFPRSGAAARLQPRAPFFLHPAASVSARATWTLG